MYDDKKFLGSLRSQYQLLEVISWKKNQWVARALSKERDQNNNMEMVIVKGAQVEMLSWSDQEPLILRNEAKILTALQGQHHIIRLLKYEEFENSNFLIFPYIKSSTDILRSSSATMIQNCFHQLVEVNFKNDLFCCNLYH
jgi:serine/threonine protein kinase